MPSETAPQDRVWMAFPTGGYTLGDTEEEAHAARSTWAAVANAVLEFEPVTMVVAPDDVETAARYLDPRVEVLTAELNDAWMRDIGPSFVLDANKQLGAVDWIFNGWGAQDWAAWDKDSQIAANITGRANATHLPSGIVNEGGGIQVDGEGTVLVTETVQLDEGRNPGLTKSDIEEELARTIGATHVVWLPRGLTRDSEKFGTAAMWTSWPPSPPRAHSLSIPSRTLSTPIMRCPGRSSTSCAPPMTQPDGTGTSSKFRHPKPSLTTRATWTTATSTTW